ncbi:phage major capsid protein [Roseovarius salinarum]|uniref:phage major capsid protein n=1 Tax=Roseovarius salinarum TaxID=1981892 RepID=UPI000C31FD46|nr:phage major capsid protein [Roseovarius salinarum]
MDQLNEIQNLVEQGNDAFSAKAAELSDRLDQIETQMGRPGAPGVKAEESDPHSDAFSAWLRDPRNDTKRHALADVEAKQASGTSDAAGGFIVPELIARPLLMRARDANTLRPIVRRIEVASGDVILPLSNADATSGWAGETDTRTGTTEPTLTGPKPTFGTLYALVEATEELVTDAAFNVADWFTMEAGAALGEAEAIAMVSGNGTNKPTGILHTAPEAGADGSRTAGAFKYLPSGTADTLGADPSAVQDLLVNLVYDLKAQYRQAGRWLMNSATAGEVRKLKDADGRMLWSDGLGASEPARLLGFPVTLSEAMPSIGADAHPIAFGDFSRGYVLADRGGLRVTVDDNVTQPGRVRWYIRRRIGGIGYDTHAVRFAKCATS